MTETTLSHLDAAGNAVMVDVSGKAQTRREAVAKGRITMRGTTRDMILSGTAPKGDVLATARIAGIMAAKKTADLIPLCHPLALSSVKVDLIPTTDTPGIEITARVSTTGPTGVEMEALTAVCVAGLTLYDMCKAVDRDMEIGQICLHHKSGGASGLYERTAPPSR
ncbi:cyclic pyranopterin monophosphate synthase MoaC [Novacetimonas hansenii]|uniref:Cyclic pyranopterin monophosphate synthase n=2 Tax=Novacetimonas hansenii TaxID=436 RepID=A0AAW5EWI3_NOVHA|nr:cyclic pyranopterin monophosphate synthase MoaC [Novacetimonas hansenii]EFG84049.1 molybdenum cofactor biosynthesis protein C [Novacetimonas hansenii ATCC 23769]MBL7236600.1 cyclic pyranopterin monophosphate synthase MoaC [Novacetimonas hansenii]MCJ8355197.1 cyclic pyranopterin monophosphate synthase MoaC [Novacetimonas hansenii]PYD73998.1 cyclic pyranopterin monophosphate synthase MoaC [Novacetimonas hansenii]QOF96409.1 cyclic pyranopterin monophosphate synthase MoaC [Novacetimonas hanseni